MTDATASAPQPLADEATMQEFITLNEQRAATYGLLSRLYTQFVKGATVSAKHILTDSEEKCAAILETIVNGEKTFEEAARESSTCPSGAQGGDLGEFGKGQMVKEFEDAAFNAEPGHVVGPVKTQFGYHLIKVEKKNEAKEAGFDEVKDPIRTELLKRKQDQAYLAKVKELKEKYVQK